MLPIGCRGDVFRTSAVNISLLRGATEVIVLRCPRFIYDDRDCHLHGLSNGGANVIVNDSSVGVRGRQMCQACCAEERIEKHYETLSNDGRLLYKRV
jgi:hypothetical protein